MTPHPTKLTAADSAERLPILLYPSTRLGSLEFSQRRRQLKGLVLGSPQFDGLANPSCCWRCPPARYPRLKVVDLVMSFSPTAGTSPKTASRLCTVEALLEVEGRGGGGLCSICIVSCGLCSICIVSCTHTI